MKHKARIRVAPELRVLIDCIQVTASCCTEAANQDNFDWEYLFELAMHHRLFPLAYHFFKTKRGAIPEHIFHQLRKAFFEYSLQDVLIRSRLTKIVEKLDKEGIRYCLLKGPVLGQYLYGNSELRPSKDLDILVAKQDVIQVVNLLQRINFATDFFGLKDVDWKALFSCYHHIELYDGHVRIELHWKLKSSKYQVFDDFDTENLIQRAVQKDFEGLKVYTLAPEDEFFYLVAHGSIHYWFRLRWLNDIVLYIKKYPDLNFQTVKKNFREKDMLNSYFQTLLLISDLYGEDIVQGIISQEEITDGGYFLYKLTFPFIVNTGEMEEYHPFCWGYYLKMLYMFCLLSTNGRRVAYIKYQLSPGKGASTPYLLTHLGRAFKKTAGHKR